MARLTRLSIGGYPHLVAQGTHDGLLIVRDPQDCKTLLLALQEAARTAQVAIHAYCIQASQLALLVTPQQASSLSHMMQSFGRRYVALYNRRHARTGGLWSGRYRATVIDPAYYLLNCMVYMEHDTACAYSSRAHHLGLQRDPLITDHAVYWSLGNTPFERELAYRELLAVGLSPARIHLIQQALYTTWPLGDKTFIQELQQHCSRRLVPLPKGRPRKACSVPN